MLTNEEKYEAFRKLYGDSDPTREDHRRFDALIRLLLDLPSRAEEIRVGDFIFADSRALKVVQARYSRLECIDMNGTPYSYARHGATKIAAWSSEEIPF